MIPTPPEDANTATRAAYAEAVAERNELCAIECPEGDASKKSTDDDGAAALVDDDEDDETPGEGGEGW